MTDVKQANPHGNKRILEPLDNGATPIAEHNGIVLAIASDGGYVTWMLMGRDAFHGDYYGSDFFAAVEGFKSRSGRHRQPTKGETK